MDISNSVWLLIGILVGMCGTFPAAYLLGKFAGIDHATDKLKKLADEMGIELP